MIDKSILNKVKEKVVKSAPGVDRIKIVKELFLEKLDGLTCQLNQAISSVNQIFVEQEKIFLEQEKSSKSQEKALHISEQILENHPFLLQSMIDSVTGIRALLDALQLSKTESQQQYDEIKQQGENFFIIVEGMKTVLEDVKTNNINSQQQYDEIKQQQNEITQRYEGIKQQQNELKQVAEKSLKIVEKIEVLKTPIIIRQSYFQGIEVGLMAHLYSFLPNNLAIDVGANVGDVSSYLLDTGYEVYSFEPFSPIFEQLVKRFENNPLFHGFPLAIGSVDETRDLFIVSDQTFPKVYQDSTLYNSLVQHSLCEGLVFTDSVSVNVRSLESLHQSSEIPSDISLVKIDTEGFDLEVLKGMGEHRYPVVMAEFWDAAIPFGESGARNQLSEMVRTMKTRGYGFHIAIYRLWGSTEASYYCNHPYSIENSWGNVFFFREHKLFTEALQWCSATMPPTYLTA